MRDSHTALSHHSHQVAIAKIVSEIPTDAENDDCAIEVAATEQGRCVRERLLHATDYQPTSAFAPEPLIVSNIPLFCHKAGRGYGHNRGGVNADGIAVNRHRREFP
jgi:hypothetical protein